MFIAESNTKRIQHRDGGIIAKILVKDGDRVQPGQDLVVLDDTETRAELGIVNSSLTEFLAKPMKVAEAKIEEIGLLMGGIHGEVPHAA